MNASQVMVLKPGQFKVKVLSVLLKPASWPEITMTLSEDKAGITFLFGDDQIIFPFGSFTGLPWLPPLENNMRFGFLGLTNVDIFVEFKSHEDLLDAHRLLKNKYLVSSQFTSPILSPHGNVTKNMDSGKSASSKKLGKRHTMQEAVILNSTKNEMPSQVNQSVVWKPSLKRIKKSFNLDAEQNAAETEDLSTELNGLSLNDFANRQKANFSGLPTIISETSGFANLGNTCYMNSILQGLFANWIFVKELYKFCMKIEERGLNLDEEMPLSLVVASLARGRGNTISDLKIKLLEAIQSTADFMGDGQQDALEFLVSILGHIEEECDVMLCEQYGIQDKQERNTKNPVTSNFAFIIESSIKCDRCEAITKNEEQSVILPVSIQMLEQDITRSETSTYLTVQTLLNDYLKTEKVNKKCENCSFTYAEKTQKFARIPRCFILFIKRYVFQGSIAVKRDDEIEVPLYLTLNKGFVDEATQFPALSPTTEKIDLKTIRPLGRKLFLNAKRRLKVGNAANGSNSSVVDAQSTGTGKSKTDTLSLNLSNLTIENHTNNPGEVDVNMDSIRGSRKSDMKRGDKTILLSEQFEDSHGELETLDNAHLPNVDNGERSFGSEIFPPSSIEALLSLMSEEEIPPIEILESLLLQDESLCKEVLESLLSQQLISRNEAQDLLRSHGMDLTYTESPQKKSCHRGERLSVGYHSDTDVNLMEKEKKRKIRKRKLSGDLGCHRRSETTVFKLRREMVEDTWLNMVNDNKENIPPRNLAESKQKIQECKSASDEPKKMLTYKKFSHHEMTIIPIGYLQINREAFCNRDIIYRRNRSIMHHTSQDVENLGNDEIVDFFGLQPVPYKPLSEGKRNEICALIGLFPRENWMIESSICWMSMYDEPDFLVAVPGNDNRLYQALAHYITGDSNDFHQIRQAIIQFEVEHPAEFMNLKQWDKIAWHSHLNTLFSNTENGSDVELFAFASKFKVDIWIFHKQQWFCYRPKFLVVNGQCKNLSIQQYHIGENEGIYLHYENGVFFPVFKPSNNWLSTEHFCRMDSNDSVIMTQPSYRLISFVNHLGEEVDSGHYISNIWCNESKTWILCDDESVEQISERSVQTKSTTGYIFFYLHREVFENE